MSGQEGFEQVKDERGDLNYVVSRKFKKSEAKREAEVKPKDAEKRSSTMPGKTTSERSIGTCRECAFKDEF